MRRAVTKQRHRVITSQCSQQACPEIRSHPPNPTLQTVYWLPHYFEVARLIHCVRYVQNGKSRRMHCDQSTISEYRARIVHFGKWLKPILGNLPLIWRIKATSWLLRCSPSSQRSQLTP